MISIDSLDVEERIKALVGIKCHTCLDSGIEKTFVNGEWKSVCEKDITNSSEKPVFRLKKCDCGKDYGY